MFNFKGFKSRTNFNSQFSGSGINLAGTTGFKRRLPSFSNFNLFNLSSGKVFLIALTALIVLGLFFLSKIISTVISSPQSSLIDARTQLPAAKANQTINKEFSFSLKDQKGTELSKLKVILENVELRNQIIVKAQKVTAISGRTFLVLNIKITNEFNQTVQINTRDYFRLSVNNKDKELLAPEIHNDPVEAQASSVKYTKLAFAINDSDKNLKLRVGELSDDKKAVIDLNLK